MPILSVNLQREIILFTRLTALFKTIQDFKIMKSHFRLAVRGSLHKNVSDDVTI